MSEGNFIDGIKTIPIYDDIQFLMYEYVFLIGNYSRGMAGGVGVKRGGVFVQGNRLNCRIMFIEL